MAINQKVAELQEKGAQTLDFAETVFGALGMFACIEVMILDANSPLFTSQARWVGDVPNNIISRAPHIVHLKTAEVVRNLGIPGHRILTPVMRDAETTRMMGGAGIDQTAVACSKLSEEFDKFFAVLLLHHANTQKLRLNSVGFGFPDLASLAEADQRLKNFSLGVGKAAGNDAFFRMGESSPEHYYRRNYLATEAKDCEMHIDFVASRPAELLWDMSSAFNTEPTMTAQKQERHSLVGELWIQDIRKQRLGIRAYGNWWNPEE